MSEKHEVSNPVNSNQNSARERATPLATVILSRILVLANSSADSFSSGDSRWRPSGRAMGKSRDKKGQGFSQADKAKDRSEKERLRKHRQRNASYCFSDADDREFEAQASVASKSSAFATQSPCK